MLFIRQDIKDADARNAWPRVIFAKGSCNKAPCFGGVYTRTAFIRAAFIGCAYVGVIFVRITCIGSISTVKYSRIYSRVFRIYEVGLTDMLLKLETGVGAS